MAGKTGGSSKLSWLKSPTNKTAYRAPQRQAQRTVNKTNLEYLAKERNKQAPARDAQLQAQSQQYADVLRQRYLSNVMGPRRNNFDVGFNDIKTLNSLNSIWGSSSITEQERILRQNATPPGYMWTPYGIHGKTAYVPVQTRQPEKKMRAPEMTRPVTSYGGGGGYGGYGGYDYGGGGGGSGGDYTPDYWNSLMTWKIK